MRFYFVLALLCPMTAWCDPSVRILLPERARFLVEQRFDVVVEGRSLPSGGSLRLTAAGIDLTARIKQSTTDLDCDGSMDQVWRVDLFSFPAAGLHEIRAEWTGSPAAADSRSVRVQPFTATKKNLILFIGDAMGNAYRDAARIVARSVETKPGVPGFRQGFLDQWNEMDRLPVTGLVMTYGYDTLVPDSAQTASHWSSGNKPLTGTLSAFPDGTDCRWRKQFDPANYDALRDNPRVESLLEYLKRRAGYRTGNVSTAFITDATPAAQGSHVPTRAATFEVARQYLENPMLGGKPAFDLILGGGKEDFDPDIRADGRNLVADFERQDFRFVSTAADLQSATTLPLLGLFRRPNTVATAKDRMRATANGNMDVAYDKLGLKGKANKRPGSEPLPDFGPWTDQPFLDAMTRKAIELLSKDGRPFALQVEGGSVDKQSHPNHAAGTIWDAIELDKAVGVARAWAKLRASEDTVIIVTGDHDQSMVINGVAEISDADLLDREPIAEVAGQKVYKDSAVNQRSNLGAVPPETRKFAKRAAFPDYIDADGDGYPENREANGKGRRRIAVGFRTGGHAGTSLPVTAGGPGALLFNGYMDQTDLFFRMAAAVGTDTSDLDRALEILLRVKPPSGQ